jgi:circadian clock protein KaiB
VTEGDATESFAAAIAQRPDQRYILRLFVVGSTPRGARTIAKLRRVCDRHLGGRYELEVVDLNQQPERADADDILAVPTLLKQMPLPVRRIVGEIANEGRILAILGLAAAEGTPLHDH